ncbi:protein PEAK3 [Rhea pennata]|uniref:protein PEAK3 n=1 Tax=Rhea pennata TaxID=8795 RepID=UPI002E2765CE
MPDPEEGHSPQPPDSTLIYSNMGEVRAHLVPTKASRKEGAGRPPSQTGQDPLPPPLPKKQLQRAESLPEQGLACRSWDDTPPRTSSGFYSIPPSHPRHEEGAGSSNPLQDRPCWGPKRPLTKSQSLGAPVTQSSLQKGSLVPSPSPAELTFSTPDGELGCLFQVLERRAEVCEVVVGCQWASLARLSANIQEGLLGKEDQQQLLRAELAGKKWADLKILEKDPCCESGDAWYFRVVFAFEQAQLVFAAKLAACPGMFYMEMAQRTHQEEHHWGNCPDERPQRVLKSHSCSLAVHTSLGVHCNIQQVIGHFTDSLPQELALLRNARKHSQSQSREEDTALLGSPPVLQVLISPEVPYQTLADFVKESHNVHRTSPGHYERLACLLLLQVCTGLEHLKMQNAGQGDICPENLLLLQCPRPSLIQQGKETSLGLSLPRLLISNFFKAKEKRRPCSTTQEQDWTEGFSAPPSPVADELNVGMLIYTLLHVDISLENALGLGRKRLPEIPSLSIYSTGLKRLAVLLLHRDPCKRVSVEQAKNILQVLLWGPRQELFARSKKTLVLLRSWMDIKRALLLLKFAEKMAGVGGSPSLEELLCCQYFKEVTEHTIYQVTQDLYNP